MMIRYHWSEAHKKMGSQRDDDQTQISLSSSLNVSVELMMSRVSEEHCFHFIQSGP
jgi:hypothetical protein